MQDKRRKVLIVDDEFRIGMLIKKLIHWDEIGLECVNVADNGESAYNIILSEKPDIVITDIRMPKINGLDLICMTKEKNEEIKFIVISGYKEFEYAHRALQYGVNDYLLKPINEEELNSVLKKIQEDLNKECEKQKEEEQLKKTVTTSEQIIKSNLLNSIIDETDNVLVDQLKNDYNFKLKETSYRGIDIKLDYWDYEKIDKRQDRLTIEKILLIIEKNFKGKIKEQLVCEKDNLNIFCLIAYDIKNGKEIKNVINGTMSEIKDFLLGFEQYEATIGIGSERSEFGEIRFSIRDAFLAVQNRIKIGTGRLIYAETLQLEKQINLKDYLETLKEPFLTSIEAYSKGSLEQSINLIYSELEFKDNVDFSCCYELAKELINLFFEHIPIQNKEGDQLKQFLINTYQQCYTIVKLKDLLKNYMGEYLEVCLKLLETESTKPIRQAKQYIDDHYGEKIVLEDIAKIVDLNPVYFSVLFKKETGMNFSAYLVTVRMEIAKKMIRNSNETIAAIADMVGYKDVRHFSQTFTKIVGIKPALYRKLHS